MQYLSGMVTGMMFPTALANLVASALTTLPIAPDAVVGVAVGLGLAAAAGFRVFVPLLAAAIAAKAGVVPLSPEFSWLAGTPALAALGTATILEVGAYAVPWLDQLLDVVATPAAVIAGMLVAASVVVDLPPVLKWGAVLLAGGAAGATQGATVFTRFKSTTLTGGAANPFVSTLELIGAVITSALAIFVPVITVVAVLLLLVFFTRRVHAFVFGRSGARRVSDGVPRVPRGP